MRIKNSITVTLKSAGSWSLLSRAQYFTAIRPLPAYNRVSKVGVLQFYRHRQGPFSGTGGIKHRRLFRRPRTTNERRARNRHVLSEAPEFSHLQPTDYLVPALAKTSEHLCLDVPRCQNEGAGTIATTTPIRIALANSFGRKPRQEVLQDPLPAGRLPTRLSRVRIENDMIRKGRVQKL